MSEIFGDKIKKTIKLLNHAEFEKFANFLVSLDKNTFVCNNRGTKDGGVDGYTLDEDSQQIVVQSKHVQDYKGLIRSLNENKIKYTDIYEKCSEFIIATSLELTHEQKNELIKKYKFISGKSIYDLTYIETFLIKNHEVLNSYLGLNISENKNVYIPRDINNIYVTENIKALCKMYALKSNKVIVACGREAIGKSTAVDFLIYKELIESGTLAYKVDLDNLKLFDVYSLDEKKKYIIYIDDFIGYYTLDKNDIKPLIKFYKKLHSLQNVRIICNTRNYISESFIELNKEYQMFLKNNCHSFEFRRYNNLELANMLMIKLKLNDIQVDMKLLEDYKKLIKCESFTIRNFDSSIAKYKGDKYDIDEVMQKIISFENYMKECFKHVVDTELEDILYICLFNDICIRDKKVVDEQLSKTEFENYVLPFLTFKLDSSNGIQHYVISIKNPSAKQFLKENLNNKLNMMEKHKEEIAVIKLHKHSVIGEEIQHYLIEDESKREALTEFEVMEFCDAYVLEASLKEKMKLIFMIKSSKYPRSYELSKRLWMLNFSLYEIMRLSNIHAFSLSQIFEIALVDQPNYFVYSQIILEKLKSYLKETLEESLREYVINELSDMSIEKFEGDIIDDFVYEKRYCFTDTEFDELSGIEGYIDEYMNECVSVYENATTRHVNRIQKLINRVRDECVIEQEEKYYENVESIIVEYVQEYYADQWADEYMEEYRVPKTDSYIDSDRVIYEFIKERD